VEKLQLFKIDLESLGLLEKLDGKFVVSGSDYGVLRDISSHEKVVSVSYDGPLASIDTPPDCHLEVCIGSESSVDLAEAVHTLNPAGVNFKMSSTTQPAKVLELLKFLSPYPFYVDIVETIGRHPKEQVIHYLESYLFETGNKVRLEPFHSILNAFIRSAEIDVWRWSWVNLSSFYQVLNHQLVYLDVNGEYVQIGTLENGSIEKMDAFVELENKRVRVYTENEKCKVCSYFFACGGYSEVILGQCDEWFEIFDRLHEVSRELKKELGQSEDLSTSTETV
jgi:hypothetical protein